MHGSIPIGPCVVRGYTNHSSHVSIQYPEWTLSIGNLTVLNPGLQEVRDRIATVIADVVRRYDIDGVHFDDYFYPYPPNHIRSQDRETFNGDPRGFRSIGAWRRDNINLFVAQVADSVNAIRPSVKFGISPFGIWKNGVPAGIVGLDAYNVIYGDATAWLEAGTVDYLVRNSTGHSEAGRITPNWRPGGPIAPGKRIAICTLATACIGPTGPPSAEICFRQARCPGKSALIAPATTFREACSFGRKTSASFRQGASRTRCVRICTIPRRSRRLWIGKIWPRPMRPVR